MNTNKVIIAAVAAVCVVLVGCADHDNPELEPIDTSDVKITSDVKVSPQVAWSWYDQSEQLKVSVDNVNMDAPKGVVLRSVDLLANGSVIASKPFAGERLEFMLPLSGVPTGRLNLAVMGNLIQQNARAAQILIADNLEQIVFKEIPDFDCKATLEVTVTGRSTSGEELNRTFEVESKDHFTVEVPANELYWTPTSGTASTLEVTMTASAEVWSTNSTLECGVTRIYWGENSSTPVYKFTMNNSKGALAAKKCGIVVDTTRWGVWEGVNTGNTNLIDHFSVTEKD